MSLKKVVRLSECGYITEAPVTDSLPGVYERDVVLVHEGTFKSMDGEVEITPEHIERFAANRNGLIAKLRRVIGEGEVPLRYCPPIQLDHTVSARDTVGRLVGQLTVADVDIGKDKPVMVKGLLGRLRIMGASNIEACNDGRWIHVSIGADLSTCEINELSITPFPADPDAAMLSKKRLSVTGEYGGVKYEIRPSTEPEGFDIYVEDKKVVSHQGTEDDVRKEAERYIDSLKLSTGGTMKFTARLKKLFKLAEDKEADEKKEALKKKLMEDEKLSAEEAEEKLASLTDEEFKKLAEEKDDKELSDDEEKEKLAAEEEKKKELSAARAGISKLAKEMVATSNELNLAARKAKVNARLSAIRKAGKITPAELKKIDVVSLSKMDESAAAEVLKTYSNREPVIDTAVHGSAQATNLSAVAAKYKKAKLELETRLSMPSKAASAKAELSKIEKEEADEIAKLQAESPVEHYESNYAKLSRLSDEGKKEDLKKGLKKLEEEDEKEAELGEKELSELDEKMKKLQTQQKELLKLAGQLIGEDFGG